jgi:putative endonuclease
MNTREIGKIFENKSKAYLIKKKFRILTQNYYTRFGEIDIIAKKKETLYFIEIKSGNHSFIPLQYKINPSKKRKMVKTSLHYIEKNNLKNYQILFSLIVVNGSRIEYYENIINEETYFNEISPNN